MATINLDLFVLALTMGVAYDHSQATLVWPLVGGWLNDHGGGQLLDTYLRYLTKLPLA